MKVRQALSADQRALLESLLVEVGPRLLAYVRRAFGSQLDAEEIVAETLARAADNIATVAASDRQDLYLLTVARNLCRDAFRRRRPNLLPDQQLRERPSAVPAPGDEVVAAEDRQRLLDAVDRLPPAQRWTHFYKKDKSYRQLDYILISRKLAQKNPTVKPVIERRGQPRRVNLPGEPARVKKFFPEIKANTKRVKASDHCPVAIRLKL